MVNLDTAATLGTTYFEPIIPMFYKNPNAVYEEKNSDKHFNRYNEMMLNALNLPGGIIVLTLSASHSAKIVYDMFEGRMCCEDSAHDSVYELCDWNGFYAKDCIRNYCCVYTPVNNVTGCFEFANGPANDILPEEFIAYDCTATIGRYYVDKDFWEGIDIAWGSGHKFGTPIGIGWLWLSDRVRETFKFSTSTKNNWEVIHGTASLPNYLCLTTAIEHVQTVMKMTINKEMWITNTVCQRLDDENIKYRVIQSHGKRIDSILCLELPGVNAEMLVRMLGNKEIYIGPGASACTYEGDGGRVLNYYGCNNADNCIRISANATEYPDETKYKLNVMLDELVKCVRTLCAGG